MGLADAPRDPARADAAADDDARVALDQIIRDRGEDYAALSRLLGRNAAYIQQFIKRRSPRRLGERERALLASYLGVEQHVLGGPWPTAVSPDQLALVPRLDVDAAAGSGGWATDDRTIAHVGFEPRFLRTLSASPRALSIVRVIGDSMVPTLVDGDDIMVDAGDRADRLRDGIYVLRRDDLLLVKRLTRPTGTGNARRTVGIVSDNGNLYPSQSDVPVDTLDIVGRVVWVSRRVD